MTEREFITWLRKYVEKACYTEEMLTIANMLTKVDVVQTNPYWSHVSTTAEGVKLNYSVNVDTNTYSVTN